MNFIKNNLANAITLALACTVLLLKLKNEYLRIH
mgnify:CR=1 FL=1